MYDAEYQKAYRAKNRERLKAYDKARYEKCEDKSVYTAWGRRNPELLRECKLKSNSKHKEARKAYNKQWAQKNAGRVTSYARAYNLAKKKAMPKWLSAQQLEDIQEIYANRPEGYHVDHIVPLKGKNVCGLHVSWNLQYLSKEDNIRKSNR